MTGATIRPPPAVRAEVHKRVERLFLQGVTRLLRDFGWNDDLSQRLQSLLEARVAIYEQAKEEWMRERGVGLEAFMEAEE